ncbi:hypothetical protein SASPL_120810 [Salvia splendens]|uniref:Uncharacterized protein n=1 Tax=Salvia splendens TaxID=180675 RepID=A0A8X8XW59_SALSN|nr:hypothetical protein SASPL_120810 [Salvia splendens]
MFPFVEIHQSPLYPSNSSIIFEPQAAAKKNWLSSNELSSIERLLFDAVWSNNQVEIIEPGLDSQFNPMANEEEFRKGVSLLSSLKVNGREEMSPEHLGNQDDNEAETDPEQAVGDQEVGDHINCVEPSGRRTTQDVPE